MHISVILAEKIVRLLDDSGASEVEKSIAVDIAKALIPVCRNSVHSVSDEQATDPK